MLGTPGKRQWGWGEDRGLYVAESPCTLALWVKAQHEGALPPPCPRDSPGKNTEVGGLTKSFMGVSERERRKAAVWGGRSCSAPPPLILVLGIRWRGGRGRREMGPLEKTLGIAVVFSFISVW